MKEVIRIAGMAPESIVDGPGIRFAIFAQGCPHHCQACHNPETFDFFGGREVSVEWLAEQIKKDPLLTGVTFSGGEPFCQVEAFFYLAELLEDTGINIMTYTGYTLEELFQKPESWPLLKKIDILVDGPFKIEERDLTLTFRGSKNQRIINMAKSRNIGKVVLLEEFMH
ncbi:MAG: anaerobic ribonucleoside-triphosphate reductase activating protein [Anaerovoracaceae bacterium]